MVLILIRRISLFRYFANSPSDLTAVNTAAGVPLPVRLVRPCVVINSPRISSAFLGLPLSASSSISIAFSILLKFCMTILISPLRAISLAIPVPVPRISDVDQAPNSSTNLPCAISFNFLQPYFFTKTAKSCVTWLADLSTNSIGTWFTFL